MKNEAENIELRSEELQEVLGKVPPWILRWGLTLLAAILALLLTGSAIFKYPDVVATRMVLTGTTPPAEVVAQMSGRIDSLYVKDNQSVEKGCILAVLHNPADTEDILYLKDYLDGLDPGETYELPVKELSLGALQTSYISLYSTLFDYLEFVNLNYFSNKNDFIDERIGQMETQYGNTVDQLGIMKEQLEIFGNQYRRDSILYGQGIIPTEEFETRRSNYLQGRLSYENKNAEVRNLRMQITQLKESSFDNRHQYTEQGNSLRSQIRSQVNMLKNEIKSWEMNYQLSSPIDGKITFTNYWTRYQNINAGEVVFTIIPDGNAELMGKATLPVAGAGKVKIGQKVNIRFDNFPDAEFGLVHGEVGNISLVPGNANGVAAYTVDISLPDGLTTTYRKELPFMPNMSGGADIITDDISLLTRFFRPLKKIFTEGTR